MAYPVGSHEWDISEVVNVGSFGALGDFANAVSDHNGHVYLSATSQSTILKVDVNDLSKRSVIGNYSGSGVAGRSDITCVDDSFIYRIASPRASLTESVSFFIRLENNEVVAINDLTYSRPVRGVDAPPALGKYALWVPGAAGCVYCDVTSMTTGSATLASTKGRNLLVPRLSQVTMGQHQKFKNKLTGKEEILVPLVRGIGLGGAEDLGPIQMKFIIIGTDPSPYFREHYITMDSSYHDVDWYYVDNDHGKIYFGGNSRYYFTRPGLGGRLSSSMMVYDMMADELTLLFTGETSLSDTLSYMRYAGIDPSNGVVYRFPIEGEHVGYIGIDLRSGGFNTFGVIPSGDWLNPTSNRIVLGQNGQDVVAILDVRGSGVINGPSNWSVMGYDGIGGFKTVPYSFSTWSSLGWDSFSDSIFYLDTSGGPGQCRVGRLTRNSGWRIGSV